ncbi:hypothetical protein KIN20_031275 [Parelaphostrongylus tenuis]|uniref:Uncharacterized protein n=1 Tax=Parelaphostrongylus tenuis TaxID=148309 RepID=A0AAD5R5A1_PARTN|nr:hypothetical protein KIN20_031275 [Parelaphostrongylus tenuis]
MEILWLCDFCKKKRRKLPKQNRLVSVRISMGVPSIAAISGMKDFVHLCATTFVRKSDNVQNPLSSKISEIFAKFDVNVQT